MTGILNQKTLSARGNRQGWILGGDLFTRSQRIISGTVFPVYSVEIALTLSGHAYNGYARVDKG
jgi:hypothetical protein